jgi:hypothetical protein
MQLTPQLDTCILAAPLMTGAQSEQLSQPPPAPG